MIRNDCSSLPNCKIKRPSRFLFLAWTYCRKRGFSMLETSFSSTLSALKKSVYRSRERVHLKLANTNSVLTFAILFRENHRRRKSSSRKKCQMYKVFIFSAYRRIYLVFLIEVLRLKFKYDFVENFMAVLLKKEFVLGDLRNRSSNKNTEIEFTVNFSFL